MQQNCSNVVPFKEHCKQMATACAPASLRNPRGWARPTGSSCCTSRGCDFIRCAGRTQLPRRNPMTRCPFRWFVAHDRIHATNGYICLHENHNNPVPWILWVVIWSASDLHFLYQIFAWGKAFYHAIQYVSARKRKQNEALDDSPSLPFEFPIMPYFFAGFFRALSRCPSSGVGFPLWRFEFVKAADPKPPRLIRLL